MNKTELVAAIAEKADLSKKDSEKALKAFVDVVTAQLKADQKVQLVGFGTFEISKRAAREGRNPQTGKTCLLYTSKDFLFLGFPKGFGFRKTLVKRSGGEAAAYFICNAKGRSLPQKLRDAALPNGE